MNCEKIQLFFMKYTENSLPPLENAELHSHLKICPNCKEDFRIYSLMLNALETGDVVYAPNDFEENVMKKIHSISTSVGNKNKYESILLFVFGFFSLFVAFVPFILLKQEEISQFIYSSPFLSYVFNMLQTIRTAFADVPFNFSIFINNIPFGEHLATIRYILIVIFIFFAIFEYMLYKSRKARV